MGANGDKPAPDVILADGRAVHFDFSVVTFGEWRKVLRGQVPDVDELAIYARVAQGAVSVDEFDGWPWIEWRKFIDALYKKSRQPLSDPN